MHILIVSKSNLKLQVFGLFSRFVRTLIIKISSSEEPANSTSIHRVRNGSKLVILFHPSPKNITERCRSLSWKPAKAHWKCQNGAERAEQIYLFLGVWFFACRKVTSRQKLYHIWRPKKLSISLLRMLSLLPVARSQTTNQTCDFCNTFHSFIWRPKKLCISLLRMLSLLPVPLSQTTIKHVTSVTHFIRLEAIHLDLTNRKS